MATNRELFPGMAPHIDLIRDVFGPDVKVKYIEENGKSKGTKTDYSKLVEPCLNRRDK